MPEDDPFEAFFGVPVVEQPRVSPAGEHVAYLRDDTGRPELHVLDAGSGDTRRLTDGQLRGHAFRSDFLWAPDGESLFACVVPDDDWHAARVERFGLDGSRDPVHDLAGQASLWSVRPDGRFLLYSARPRDSERMPLRRLDLERAESEVVADCWQVRAAEYDPDGRRACVEYVEEPGATRTGVLESGEFRGLPAADGVAGFRAWLDDRRALFAVRGDRAACAVRDVVEDAIEHAFEDDPDQRPAGVLAGNVVLRAGDSIVVRDLDGPTVERVEPGRPIADVDVRGDRVAAILAATDDRPAGLAIWAPEEGFSVRVQPDYGAVTPADRVEREELTVDAAHGEYPLHLYRADDEPAPVVAWVYGLTPRPVDHDVFQPAIDALCSRGYAVAFPGSGAEPPPEVDGPDTYAFSDAEHEDIASIGRWLREREWSDGTAVLGHSLGGWNAAMQAVRHPDAWDAAVDWQGPTDLVAHYGANGRPPLYRRCLGPLEGSEGRWREQSPAEHARDLGVALLVYHGASDRHVPIEQPRLLRDRLRAWGHERGRDFEYVEAPGEGHVTRAAEHRVRRWRTIADFLDRHV